MTLTATGTTRNHRPLPVIGTISLLVTLGLGAVGGGWAMLFGVGGESMLPNEYLDSIPLIDSWVLPGLVLGIGFGLGSLITAYGVARRPDWGWLGGLERMTRHHWSWSATIALGVGHVVWISLELIFVPLSWLMPTFGLVGLALAVLPLTPVMRQYLED